MGMYQVGWVKLNGGVYRIMGNKISRLGILPILYERHEIVNCIVSNNSHYFAI